MLFGVAILAMIGNLFFRKLDFEKRFKFVGSKVIRILAKNHVRSGFDTMRLAYETYINRGIEKTK